MRANSDKADDRPTSARKTSGRGPQHPGAAAQLLALQSAVGNSTLVQLLREAGDPWLAEPHQHGAGCGHQGAEQAVQRSSVTEVLRGGGRPLDASTRADMQNRMGADFSDVRVHDDAAARASAAEIGARAYTAGSHIVIGAGGADKHTLAHELTHVVQQRQGPVAGTVGASGLKISDPSDRFERQAEANARRVMSGGSSLLAPSGAAHAEQHAGRDTEQPGAVQQSSIQRVHYPTGERVTADPGFCVILHATLNGVHLGHFTSETSTWSPQDHAEDQLVDEIESAVLFASSGHVGVATQGAGGDVLHAISSGMYAGVTEHELRISLSASPCSRRQKTTTKGRHDGCAERLIHLARMRFGQDRAHRFRIVIDAHHLYQPRHLGREARAKSRAANDDMRAAGIEISVG
jgi:hypothetical protein